MKNEKLGPAEPDKRLLENKSNQNLHTCSKKLPINKCMSQ